LENTLILRFTEKMVKQRAGISPQSGADFLKMSIVVNVADLLFCLGRKTGRNEGSVLPLLRLEYAGDQMTVA
jgi:hypothetical protein